MSDFEQRLSDLAATAGQAAGPRPAQAIRRRAEQRVTQRHTAVGVAVVALLGGFAYGFLRPVPDSPVGGGSPSATASPSAAVSAPPSPSAPTPGTPPPSSDDAAAPPPAATCRFEQLRVWQAPDGSAGGHLAVIFVFENVSGTPCRLHGYPGLDALNANGKTVANARRTLQGYMGGVTGTAAPTVELAPGGLASAVAEVLLFDPTDTNACLPQSNVLVTPPNTAQTVAFGWNESCAGLEIHPVVPGTSGRT